MKKLVLTLLMSCVVAGTVSAADSVNDDTNGQGKGLWALQAGITRVVPALAGYMIASAAKERVGSYGFMAFLGLSLVPFALDTNNVEGYKVNPLVKTALNSFGAGVAAREVVSLAPVGAKARLAALTGANR